MWNLQQRVVNALACHEMRFPLLL